MKRKIFFILLAAVFAAGIAFAEKLPVAKAFRPEKELYKTFANPDARHRPYVRWWWNGARVNEQEILRELDVMHKAGIGGVEINVPMDVDYAALGLGDSVIHAGYQTLNGASMEFLLRARKIYPDGDIGRLNMQRQFYAALFRKLKSIGNIWDVAKLTPAVLNYMETNLSASDLISFAISMLKIDSSKIMICQMPVISGPQYNGQSLLYPARQADADLLNQYFRENTGPVDASQLNLCDNVIDLSGYTATDPKIQQMGGLMAEADDAQKNDNLDGSNQVTDIMASESTAESESTDTDSTDTESQPAA